MIKKFEEVLEIKNGRNQKSVENVNGQYPIYGSGGIMGYADDYICNANTVIIGRKGSINNPIFVETPFWNVDTAFGLVPKENVILPRYLFYFCKNFNFEKLNTTVTIPSLTKANLLNIEINIPSIIEQRDIIDKLQKIECIIRYRKQQLEELSTLVKARFVEMFGDMANPECQYPKYKLVEACKEVDDIKCGPFGTQLNKEEYQTEGIAVWEIPQINSGFVEKPTHFLTKEKAQQLKAYSIVPGDIAMSRKGNVGKCGLYPENYELGIIHSDVLRIRIDSNRLNPCFIMHQFHYSGAIKRQIEMVSSGAIMAGINVTKLKQIEVYVPPLNLQNQFAAFVAQTDKSKVAIQKSLDETQLLFDSLMQKYFG